MSVLGLVDRSVGNVAVVHLGEYVGGLSEKKSDSLSIYAYGRAWSSRHSGYTFARQTSRSHALRSKSARRSSSE
jgi:hypothetical protein